MLQKKKMDQFFFSIENFSSTRIFFQQIVTHTKSSKFSLRIFSGKKILVIDQEFSPGTDGGTHRSQIGLGKKI